MIVLGKKPIASLKKTAAAVLDGSTAFAAPPGMPGPVTFLSSPNRKLSTYAQRARAFAGAVRS